MCEKWEILVYSIARERTDPGCSSSGQIGQDRRILTSRVAFMLAQAQVGPFLFTQYLWFLLD